MTALRLPPDTVALAFINPLASVDQTIAHWFHAHLTPTFVAWLRIMCEPGSSEWVGVTVFFGVVFFAWKRLWPSLIALVVAVPGGMLLNEWVKVIVHRPRPYVAGAFVDWSGYSFASGHTIGATLLYGQIALFLMPAIASRRCRHCLVISTAMLVMLVGFSRIALGAHYLTDVLAAIALGILWLAICLTLGKVSFCKSAAVVLPAESLLIEPELAVVPVLDQAAPPSVAIADRT